MTGLGRHQYGTGAGGAGAVDLCDFGFLLGVTAAAAVGGVRKIGWALCRNGKGGSESEGFPSCSVNATYCAF
jgi:hypothetical protein